MDDKLFKAAYEWYKLTLKNEIEDGNKINYLDRISKAEKLFGQHFSAFQHLTLVNLEKNMIK